jgi:hypothetical protein
MTKAAQGRPCPSSAQINGRSRRSALDDDLAAVVIDIAIVIALLDNNGFAVAVIAALAYDVPIPIPVAVAVAVSFTDGHATRTHADADLFRRRREGGCDKRGSRDNSKT